MRAPRSLLPSSLPTGSAGAEIDDGPTGAAGQARLRPVGLLRLTDHHRRWLDDVAFVELEERSRIDQETSDLRRRRARAYELRAAKAGASDAR